MTDIRPQFECFRKTTLKLWKYSRNIDCLKKCYYYSNVGQQCIGFMKIGFSFVTCIVECIWFLVLNSNAYEWSYAFDRVARNVWYKNLVRVRSVPGGIVTSGLDLHDEARGSFVNERVTLSHSARWHTRQCSHFKFNCSNFVKDCLPNPESNNSFESQIKSSSRTKDRSSPPLGRGRGQSASRWPRRRLFVLRMRKANKAQRSAWNPTAIAPPELLILVYEIYVAYKQLFN